MSGQIEFQFYPLILMSVVAAGTDLARGRIYNWLTLPAIALGLIGNLFFLGLFGLESSFLGVVCALVLYGWMYLFRAMGAGDVKFLMALGAWGGWRYCAHTGVLALVLGGALALIILVVSGRLQLFLRRMYTFFLTLFVKELELDLPKLDQKLTMPFGVPIAIAAIWVEISDPFVRWGVTLW